MVPTVLVVDDEPLVLDVTAVMLGELGCDVVTATNAREALAKLASDRSIEILLTDINMPGMNGFELARKARESRTDIAVVAMSGGSTDSHGGLPLIRKPLRLRDLSQLMDSIGRRH